MAVEQAGWQIFPTAMGECGIAWCEQGVTRFLLPDTAFADMQTVLQECTGTSQSTSKPPMWIRELVKQIRLHCKGERQDFSAVPVHIAHATDFMLAVYASAQQIPAGSVLGYAELAKAMGRPGAARAVGSALGKNPVPLIVPCHRVVAAAGKPGGFTSPGGLATKKMLLACEGVALEKPAVLANRQQWQHAVRNLRRDKRFARLYKQVGDIEFRPQKNEDPLAAFIDAIVSQQLSTKVAATILKRVHAITTVNGRPNAKKILALPDAGLREAGLSGMKVSYLKDLARHSVDGLLPSRSDVEKMPDEEIIRRFTAVKGIGRWSVEMYLIFDLGRADVFPVDDYGIRKAIAKLHALDQLPPAKQMLQYGENWKPYRSVASLYLWRSLDNA